jgi:ribosomal protein S18 acetylase RimI-like enzyme
MNMVEIRQAEKKDHAAICRIIVPVFSDKAQAILGDASKAMAITPILVDALEGLKLLAYVDDRPVGAIMVSTEELKLPAGTFKVVRREVGFFGALRAVRIVSNYDKSLPSRLDREARLEAVGVADEARSKGIGTQLINRAEEWVVKNGMRHFGLSVKTDNPAVRLYERLGFEKASSFSNRLGQWYYMRKELGT